MYLLMEKSLEIRYLHVDSLDELSPADRTLVAEAEKALAKAYPKYSHFSVGAAVRLRSGAILHGANSESEVFPSGICAELQTGEQLRRHVAATSAKFPRDIGRRVSNPCRSWEKARAAHVLRDAALSVKPARQREKETLPSETKTATNRPKVPAFKSLLRIVSHSRKAA